jgi:hypothetical protein
MRFLFADPRPQVSQDIPAYAGYLRDRAAMLRAAMKGTASHEAKSATRRRILTNAT